MIGDLGWGVFDASDEPQHPEKLNIKSAKQFLDCLSKQRDPDIGPDDVGNSGFVF